MGKLDDFNDVVNKANVEAVAIATVFHYNLHTVKDVRDFGIKKKISLRKF